MKLVHPVAERRLALAARGLNVVLAVSTGNEAVVGVDDVFDHLVRSDGADLFVLFVEAIRKPGLFLSAAAAARRLRPRRTRGETPAGLGAFESAPCYREVSDRRRSDGP